MTLSLPISTAQTKPGRRYLRAPVPLHFPEEEQVPESATHRERLNLLSDSVRHALGDQALVCSDQFLYWDPTNPKRCLAPDLAVRVGGPNLLLASWKTWEHGAPHVGVEIVSDWDTANSTTEQKLERYRQAGIAEVVRFDPEGKEPRLRFWDLIESDLVERDLSDPEARRCDALGLYWCIVDHSKLHLTLRLARDKEGHDLLLTPAETALARVAELEAELARKR
jgi:hypothetical protein